jgi:hypothetical protein
MSAARAARKETLIVPMHVLRVPLVVLLTFSTMAASPLKKTTSASCGSCLACASESEHPRTVHVWLFNQTRMKDDDLADILATANTLWVPYGVSIERGTGVEAIKVVVSRNGQRSDTTSEPVPLGDTLFSSGHATPYIHLWLGAAEALALGSNFEGHSFMFQSIDERNAILRHMLGVALAHELGHYLLDTSSHSSAGLLRQTLGFEDLAHPKPGHLRLTDRQQRLMCSKENGTLADPGRRAADPDRQN